MSVVTGSYTNPLKPLLTTPRALRAENTEKKCSGERVIHKLKRGVTTYRNILRLYTEHIGEKTLHLGDTVKHTVVTAVYAILGKALLTRSCLGKKRKAYIELIGVWLTSRKIELEPHSLIFVILRHKGGVFFFKFVFAKFLIGFHSFSLFWSVF